jgi:acetoin utilization deacetylase AcuC-like enzyme
MSPDAADGGYTALLEAARRGHGGVALELAKAGADINARDHASGRLVSMLEGGYSLEGLASAVSAHAETLLKI